MDRRFPSGFDAVHAGEVYGHHVLGASSEHLLEVTHADRSRIFNLGYFTWAEQQGVPLESFEARRSAGFWRGLRALPAAAQDSATVAIGATG